MAAILQCCLEVLFGNQNSQEYNANPSAVVLQPPSSQPVPTPVAGQQSEPTSKVLFKNSESIPIEFIENQCWLEGECTLAIDGDTFKFFHKSSPTMPTPTNRSILKQETITIRIAGIDAPEIAHGDQPGQPFGKESTDYLKSLIQNQYIRIKLLDRDQYGRVVALVMKQDLNIGIEMLNQGLADLYSGKGANYDKFEHEMKAALKSAKQGKKGIWSLDNFTSPSQYKKRH